MSAPIFISGLLAVLMPPHAFQAISALYANLAKPFFATIYAKSLIPRLGT